MDLKYRALRSAMYDALYYIMTVDCFHNYACLVRDCCCCKRRGSLRISRQRPSGRLFVSLPPGLKGQAPRGLLPCGPKAPLVHPNRSHRSAEGILVSPDIVCSDVSLPICFCIPGVTPVGLLAPLPPTPWVLALSFVLTA